MLFPFIVLRSNTSFCRLIVPLMAWLGALILSKRRSVHLCSSAIFQHLSFFAKACFSLLWFIHLLVCLINSRVLVIRGSIKSVNSTTKLPKVPSIRQQKLHRWSDSNVSSSWTAKERVQRCEEMFAQTMVEGNVSAWLLGLWTKNCWAVPFSATSFVLVFNKKMGGGFNESPSKYERYQLCTSFQQFIPPCTCHGTLYRADANAINFNKQDHIAQ